MNSTHRAQRVVVYQRNGPVRPGQGLQRCASGGACCTKCLLIVFTIMFLLVGLLFCREKRGAERNFKNCRVVGPILLAIGGVLLIATIGFIRAQRKKNQRHGQVILREARTGEINTTRQGGTATATTSSIPYPANTFGYQQPYGQSPAYPPGQCPSTNPPPSAPGSYSSYSMGQLQPPAQHPYPPQQGPGVQPYQTDIPPPPSYDTVVNQGTPTAPLEKVGY